MQISFSKEQLNLAPKFSFCHFDSNLAFQIPFLERDDIDSLPYVVTATLLTLPVSLHEDVLDVLCWHLLPFTMNTAERPSTVDNCVLPGTCSR